MLRIDGVSVNFGKVRALRDVSLEVAPGSFHGIIGPNGAGKSTLIDVVSGRRAPSAGRVTVEGEDVTKRSVAWRKRHGISRSFQRTSIFPTLTVREQLDLVAELGTDVSVDDVAEAIGLTRQLDEIAGITAYGDQRRVDLALALIGRTKLLLMDEPGAGLSTAETLGMFAHVQALVKENGLTAVVVEHDVNAVFATCDSVTVLDLGSVLASGDPGEVRRDERVIKAYLGSGA
jgi:branched-chain amino acid transport system ATP-binding protein